ncbi:uncharacterized protein METZ01_LOCUS151543 [marine metagenome]|uniref:PhoD-like phosphatase metallophosphatase domain-containing protein n=1 Tax=marine metagenome TaxID=408172 RepID=A0A382ABC1_9ZZZZ
MIKSLSKQIALVYILSIFSPSLYAYKLGVGSCIDQNLKQDIWITIKKHNIDGFIFLGDNVYGDTSSGKLDKMKRAYAKQKSNFPSWLNKKDIIAIWDDHDYGVNDGGGDYKNKNEAKKLFIDFWEIPVSDIRRKRQGLYFERSQLIEDKEIQYIVLDTRYFRSPLNGETNNYQPNKSPYATVLGNKQWKWFRETLRNSEAEIIFILSSIQVLATNHPYEKWANFPHERKRLLKEIKLASQDKTIIALSGDRHRSGIYQNDFFLELTSSSLNKASSITVEYDPLLIGRTYPEVNFGLIEIDSKKNLISLSIRNKLGKELQSKIIKL